MAGNSNNEVHLSTSVSAGTTIYCFVVSADDSEASLSNNAVCKSITLYSLADLHLDSSNIAADATAGTITFVVYNFVVTAATNVTLPVYQYIDAETSVLLGYTAPTNISGSALQFVVIDNLTDLFNSISNPYLYQVRVDVPAQYTASFTASSTVFTLSSALASKIPATLVPNRPLYQQLGLSTIASQLVHLHDNISIPIVVTHFDSTANSSFTISIASLPKYMSFVANDYTHTGIAYINFYVSDAVPLDDLTQSASFTNITVTLTSEAGVAISSVSFDVTVSSCPTGYVTCKNFACAPNITLCGFNSLMCPLSKPTLIGQTCLSSLSIPMSKYTQSIDVSKANILELSAVGVSIFVPAGALSAYGNMSFTALQLAGWVHSPFSFDSSSSYDAEEEKNLLSSITTIDVVDTTITKFNKAITITYPAWWNTSEPVPDLDYYCLGTLNATGHWVCAAGSALILPTERGKREVYTHQIQATTLVPGSYSLFVNPNPPSQARHHHKSRAGMIAGVTIGVIAFVAICVFGAYLYIRKPAWATELKSKVVSKLPVRRRRNSGLNGAVAVELEVFGAQPEI